MSDVHIERDLVIMLADGTRLSGDVYRPSGVDRGPVLVSYYPYRKDDIIGSLFEACRIRLCERGYASMFVDMAGTGASEGRWECFDLSSEGRDCAEIVEWAARQDWCDGNVGAWGFSYGGMTALAAAACRPPHLRAIMAAYATTDIYNDAIARGGCATMLGRYAWSSHMVALGLCPPTLQDPGGRWRRTWNQRLRNLTLGQPAAVNWQSHRERDDYWQARVVDATAIEIPTMLIGGWADTYKDAMIRIFGSVRGPKRLVMGPWMHVLPHLSEAEPYDWVAAMADWWDAYLRPESVPDAQQEAPVLFFAEGDGWRSAQQWPPVGITQMSLYLAGHGLVAAPPPKRGIHLYHGDPMVGLAGGLWDPFGTGNGWPEEQSGDDARSLTFTSEPLAEQLLIAGRPEAELYLTHPHADETHLVARLSLVDPSGQSRLITAGWCKVAASDASNSDVDMATTIVLGPAAFVLPAGMRVRLSLSCADFPRIWPSPTNPEIGVRFGVSSPSVLRMPVSREMDRSDTQATITTLAAGHDSGWITDGEPAFNVFHDKAADEVAVAFGARSRLRAPSGADIHLDELFTARLQPGRPDGAALLARIDVSIRMPAGERVEISVRSSSSRQASIVDASVAVNNVGILRHRWAGDGTLEPDPRMADP